MISEVRGASKMKNVNAVNVARWVSLLAAFVVGAVAEWKLGLAVGWDPYTAGLLPLVLDVYGFAAFMTGRTAHVAGALGAMFGTQMVSHLLELGHVSPLMVGLSIAVSAIPPAVSLACHRLGVEPDAVDTQEGPRVIEMTTAVNGHRPDYTIVDEIHEWTRGVDTDDKPVSEPVSVPAATVDTDDDKAEPLSKADYAARGKALIASGMTKTEAAKSLGITRQWLHSCMKEHA